MAWFSYLRSCGLAPSVCLLCGLFVISAAAETYRVTPRNRWFETIHGNHLKPGDEVVLETGVYRDRRKLVMGHRGTADRPIVIRAADGARAVLQRPDNRQNTVNIVGGQHLILRGLEITGGSAGVRLVKSGQHECKFVTLERMHIHHVGGAAITANNADNAYEGLVLRRNHIHHTSGHGEGIYLGSNNGPSGETTGFVFNCLVEGNYIHHLNGQNVSQGDGIEIKDGSYNNIVRDNVIHDTRYPGITVFGADSKSPNTIERNLIWNSDDHGIQAAADSIVRNNLIFNVRNDGIRSHNHQSAKVGRLDIRHNTVVCNDARSHAIRVNLRNAGSMDAAVTIANNALYAFENGASMRFPTLNKPASHLVLAGNRGRGRISGLSAQPSKDAWNPDGDLAQDLDRFLYPLAGSTLINAADQRYGVSDDFNGSDRGASADAGAYRYSAQGNPGWRIGPGFKRFPMDPP